MYHHSMNIFLEFLLKNPSFALIFGIILLFLIVLVSWKGGEAFARFRLKETVKTAREDAVNRSKAVVAGLAAEQIAPFLPQFPCNPADCRFVGKPVDFVAFPGSTADEEIKEILFVEVKTGTSQLTKREKEIKSCIQNGKIRYIEYRIQ